MLVYWEKENSPIKQSWSWSSTKLHMQMCCGNSYWNKRSIYVKALAPGNSDFLENENINRIWVYRPRRMGISLFAWLDMAEQSKDFSERFRIKVLNTALQ